MSTTRTLREPKAIPAMAKVRVQLEPIVRAKTLGDQAYASLREALASGALAPGHRLTVRGVVDLLGIGFTPAREALNRLGAEGGLDIGASRRLMVPTLTLARYEELVQIRMELEPMAAVAALAQLVDADVAALRVVQDGLLAAKKRKDYVRVLARNREFFQGSPTGPVADPLEAERNHDVGEPEHPCDLPRDRHCSSSTRLPPRHHRRRSRCSGRRDSRRCPVGTGRPGTRRRWS